MLFSESARGLGDVNTVVLRLNSRVSTGGNDRVVGIGYLCSGWAARI